MSLQKLILSVKVTKLFQICDEGVANISTEIRNFDKSVIKVIQMRNNKITV